MTPASIGYALGDRRERLHEVEVALLRGRAQRLDDAHVLGGGVLLQSGAHRRRVARNAVDDLLLPWRVNQQQVGVLNRGVEILGRRARVQADRVGEPPLLGRELDDVLLALPVDDEAAQAAARDERRMARRLARALQKVSRGQRLWHEHRPHERELLG